MLKRTPLYAAHQRLGARLVEFGGWEMPVQYTSIVEEHKAVRQAAGLFDISHMGEVQLSGPGASAFLNHLLTNDIRKLEPGQGQYTLMCNERGGVIDDLYAYRVHSDNYLLIVNASRIEADWDWLQGQLDASPIPEGIRLNNLSDEYAAIAVQGPRVCEFINLALPGGSLRGTMASNVTDLKKNQVAEFLFQATAVSVARTGYTGEDGFEIIAPPGSIALLWDRILSVGMPFGIKPAGLGARDTLRTEVCYPLYGHELDETTTPIEAGLWRFVELEKGEFVGRSRLAAQKAAGPQRKCVAFRMADKSAPPRPAYPIWSCGPGGAQIGTVASGTQSPSMGVGIGMGYVPTVFAAPGTPIEIEVRGKRFPATIAPKPLYKKPRPPQNAG